MATVSAAATVTAATAGMTGLKQQLVQPLQSCSRAASHQLTKLAGVLQRRV
jgi:hypothetical protein